jgi:hypothetical protein
MTVRQQPVVIVGDETAFEENEIARWPLDTAEDCAWALWLRRAIVTEIRGKLLRDPPLRLADAPSFAMMKQTLEDAVARFTGHGLLDQPPCDLWSGW